MTAKRGGGPSSGVPLLAVTALIAVAYAAGASAQSDGVDFYQFWVVGQAVRQAPERDIYADAERERLGAEALERIEREAAGQPTKLVAVARYRKTLETYSTPFLYAVFGLLSTGSWGFDFAAYRIVCFVAMIGSVFILARSCRHGPVSGLALATLLSLWFAPLYSELTVANVNPLQLAFIAIFIGLEAETTWRHRTAAAGVVLGLAVVFKPNLLFVPVAVAVAWALAGRWRAVRSLALGGGAGAGAALATSVVVFGGPGGWLRWAEAVRRIPDAIITRNLGNVAPAVMIRDGLGIDAGWIQGALFGAAALAALGWARRGRSRPEAAARGEPLVAVAGLGAAIYLLSARLVWAHYLLLALPLVVWSVRPRDASLEEGVGVFRVRLAVGLLALVLLTWNPWSTLLRLPSLGYGPASWIGLLLLAGLTVTTMRNPRFIGMLSVGPRRVPGGR